MFESYMLIHLIDGTEIILGFQTELDIKKDLLNNERLPPKLDILYYVFIPIPTEKATGK